MGHIALVAGLDVRSGAHGRLGGGNGCHLLAQLTQLVAQGRHIISGRDGLGAHGTTFGVDHVLALHSVVLLEHGVDLQCTP
eukprot:2381645-Pleurochrysis_carterae.AAC.1